MKIAYAGLLPPVTLVAFLAVLPPFLSSPRAKVDSFAGEAAAGAEPAAGAAAAAGNVQLVVDRLRAQLGIAELVRVSVLPSVALVVSVEAPKEAEPVYVLRIEQSFLEQLSPVELEAAVAHELGHVWVFTHHPFLQTEPLANRIAQRVVTRDTLASVYRKLWEHGRTDEGDMNALLGPP
jgi:hypothetical protein